VVRNFAGAVVIAGVLLAACSSPAAAPASRPPGAAPSSPPAAAATITAAGPLMGVYEPDAPFAWNQQAAFGSATGVTMRIAVYYSGWFEKFRSSFAQLAWQHGSYVLVQIEPESVTLASIVTGRWDSYLRSYALAVRAFGHPVILSFGHEMNGTWYRWGSGHVSPAVFVAAWRHVVQVFRLEQASNAVWAWTVNSVNAGSDALGQWWPGASWVNLVGIDGYYYRSSDTFGSVFGRTIAKIRTFSSAPVLITETAVGDTPDRVQQITALIAGVRAAHLVGMVWFDRAQHQGVLHQDWRLEDDPAGLAAFRAAARGID
jgi:mannan endo-1,4-beta-mannosidase